jgi:hypothetical protein
LAPTQLWARFPAVEDIMKTKLSRLLLGLAGAVGGMILAVACSQPSASVVSPSATAVAGVDGSAVKGFKNFCAYIQAHENDPVYVIDQWVFLSLDPSGLDPQSAKSAPPHGEVCFSIPAGTEFVYITIDPGDLTNPAEEHYCKLEHVQFPVHNGPDYIWLLPADGTHACTL